MNQDSDSAAPTTSFDRALTLDYYYCINIKTSWRCWFKFDFLDSFIL